MRLTPEREKDIRIVNLCRCQTPNVAWGGSACYECGKRILSGTEMELLEEIDALRAENNEWLRIFGIAVNERNHFENRCKDLQGNTSTTPTNAVNLIIDAYSDEVLILRKKLDIAVESLEKIADPIRIELIEHEPISNIRSMVNEADVAVQKIRGIK